MPVREMKRAAGSRRREMGNLFLPEFCQVLISGL
jgi:hypothetical protein